MAANIEMKFVKVYCEVSVVDGGSLEPCRGSIGRRWMCECPCGDGGCHRRLVMRNVVVWGGKRRGEAVTYKIKRRKICGVRKTKLVVAGRGAMAVSSSNAPALSDDAALLTELSDLVVTDVF